MYSIIWKSGCFHSDRAQLGEKATKKIVEIQRNTEMKKAPCKTAKKMV